MDDGVLLTATGLRKTFARAGEGPVEVLRSVDLEIAKGDSIAIVGKSGTGKSTLLHVIGTLERPSKGEVIFLGQDVFRFTESRLAHFRNRELGFVFQFHYLMPEFTALENVMMPALLAKANTAQSRSRAGALLEKVGLKSRLTHRPSQLSGGERQRVAIARALMMSPKLLLTDEMTGNLDPVTGAEVFDLVKKIHMEMGTAMVSVTHDEQLASQYSRVYRLTDGVLKPEPPAGWKPPSQDPNTRGLGTSRF
jgi:lipoprotein-releasing system ATP-binding protein